MKNDVARSPEARACLLIENTFVPNVQRAFAHLKEKTGSSKLLLEQSIPILKTALSSAQAAISAGRNSLKAAALRVQLQDSQKVPCFAGLDFPFLSLRVPDLICCDQCITVARLWRVSFQALASSAAPARPASRPLATMCSSPISQVISRPTTYRMVSGLHVRAG